MNPKHDEHVAARKGDLILVRKTHRDYVIGKGAAQTTVYEFGVVASATRHGRVKTWASLGWGAQDLVSTDNRGRWITQDISHVDCWQVMPQQTVDVEAVLRAAKAHHWPGHPGQPKTFDSYDQAQNLARPFLRRPRPKVPGEDEHPGGEPQCPSM